jgi:hypothetical protein
MSAFAKKQAAINLLKIISGTATVLVIANAVRPGSVEKDPKSSDFGKIKVGNTRFDVTGGKGSMVTLASRLITNSTKSSTTGIVSKLGTGEYGAPTRGDVIYNYFENKLSPTYSVIKDLTTGEDFQGNKPTPLGELSNLLTPIIITNYAELAKDPNSADIVLAMIAEGLGISTTTYSTNVDWTQNPGVELQQFRKIVGEDKFKKANDDYNKRFASWLKLNQTNPKYKALSEEDKKKVITKKKNEIKDTIFNQYHFKYKAPKTKTIPNF